MNNGAAASERRLAVLRGKSRAKVTLSLRVLGTRFDGFHDLEALTVSASNPHDDVAIYSAPRGTSVTVTPAGAAPKAAGNNLATRAIELLRPKLPATFGGVRVRLNKRIPMGAGLGGGSSNAATVLSLLAKHYQVPRRTVSAAAAKLGSDVPFCVAGTPAMMRGRGEILESLDSVPEIHLVIATPPFGCSTPEVFRAWDELPEPRRSRVLETDLVAGDLCNDLEQAALLVAPGLEAFRDAFEVATSEPALMLGSGSSYAVIVEDAELAVVCAERAKKALGLETVWAATTIGSPKRATA